MIRLLFENTGQKTRHRRLSALLGSLQAAMSEAITDWLRDQGSCSDRSRLASRPRRLFIEPDVFHPPVVEDAVDHQGQPLHVRLTTGPAAAVEDDWAGNVLRQPPFDLPHQLPSLVLVCIARLSTNQVLYVGITVIVSVELRTTAVKQRQGLVGVTGTLKVHADAVVPAHHLGE